MQDDDAHSLAMKGDAMTAAQADSLEQTLEQNPGDINARTTLLGYYFRKSISDENAKATQARHILWLVQNAPQSEVLGIPHGTIRGSFNLEGYAKVKEAWLSHLANESAALVSLKNAARFFLHHDTMLTEKTLKRGQVLEPGNPYWPRALGQLYSLRFLPNTPENERLELATKSLEHYELAYKLATDEERDSLLQCLAKMALDADEPEKAKEYVEKMLSQETDNWNSGNNTHHGNLVLGRLAFASGDIEEAKRRLLAAGKTKGSPQLGSFGPNMVLAKDLLEANQPEVVLEYFELCGGFWQMGKDRLDNWSASVENGEMPDFGANLRY